MYPNYVYDWNANPGMMGNNPLVPAPASGFKDAAYGLAGGAPAAAPGFAANFASNLTAPIPGIAGLAQAAMGGFTPESIGAGAGSWLGSAAGAAGASALSGTALGTSLGSALGPIGMGVGAVAGSLLGGEIGSLFGGESEEEKAKKKQEKSWIMDGFARLGSQMNQYGAERKNIMDNITGYFNSGTRAQAQRPIL